VAEPALELFRTNLLLRDEFIAGGEQDCLFFYSGILLGWVWFSAGTLLARQTGYPGELIGLVRSPFFFRFESNGPAAMSLSATNDPQRRPDLCEGQGHRSDPNEST